MVYLHTGYMITPLGEGVAANLKAVQDGETRLCMHTDVHGERLVEPVMASLLDEERYKIDGFSLFESLCIHAINGAKASATVNLQDERCVFILSSTKGDIWVSMAESAKKISSWFGNPNQPIVVSTACTSGVSAQLTAWRLLEDGLYSSAVVVGCDVQSEFIVSGFQSFHALSNAMCAPFDKDRDGLNAGEAAACMILSIRPSAAGWTLLGGSIHNDANHISGPSRTAEGSLRCLNDALERVPVSDLAVISVHGTGTIYNDEMESLALHRAGLDNVPVTALKGNYGHTMGAAGLLETLLTLYALEQGIILPTKGYHRQGTTWLVAVSNQVRHTTQAAFIKLLSGFGGVNAAVAWTKQKTWQSVAEITISAPADLTSLYRQTVGDYPKFFKMDLMSKLGFMGVECLLGKVREQEPGFTLDTEQAALIVASRSASLKNDTDYQCTIRDKENYFPSPSLFVYTLPNIVAGEIAIRHHLMGETACYVLPDEQALEPVIHSFVSTTKAHQLLVAWVECETAEKYNAHIRLLIKK